MNKTVYLRDDEVPLWEKARELSGDKLSPVIVAALKRFVAEREAEAKGYERIEVSFNDSQDHWMPKIKAFYGRWIIDREKPLKLHDEDGHEFDLFSVAETAKGNVVVYTENHDREGMSAKFFVYPSFTEAAAVSRLNYAIREAIEKRGVPVEELDI
jgi:hypothetical protein